MWCRAILTAVAISYVICMLLWSGFQKEDLDVNTLEKLRRYNVNIDDMNNEQLRRECLLDQITEVRKEALRTSPTNDRGETDPVNVGIYPKIGMLLAANFEDKAVVQFNSNDTKGNFEQVQINTEKVAELANVTNFDGNKAIIKIEYNVQNHPNVESVMNFWTKLTHHTTTVTQPTTMAAPIIKLAQFKPDKAKGTETPQAETQNDGYVHSREMEYISRILAEYLSNKTVPTTTEKSFLKKKFANYVPTNHWEISNKAAVNEESKVGKQGNERSKINTTPDKALDNSMADESKSKPFKDTFNNQLLKIIQKTATSQTEPKGKESKPVARSNAKGILSRLLRMKNDLFNNGFVIPENEFEVQPIKKTNEQQGTSEPFNLFNLFQNLNDANKNSSHNFTINSSQSINASLKADTMTSNEPEVTLKPTNIKKSQVHQKLNLEHRGSRFQAMLPSIKYSKQNKNSDSQNTEVIGVKTELNKTEQHENDNVELFSVKKAVVSQQPAAIQKFAKNQLFKMKNDTLNADSGTTSNITANANNGKQFKKAPVFQKLEPNDDSKRIKAIQEIVKEFDEEYEQLTVQSLKPTQNTDSMNVSDLQGLPDNVIQEIAEKVKRMVLKDIGDNVTTTTEGTTSTTSTITTSEPSSTSLRNEFTQSNHVMQKLMEMFKELKAMKDTGKLISPMPQNDSILSNRTTIRPQWIKQTQALTSYNPYLMASPPNFKPIQASSYSSKVPGPISSRVYPLNKVPQYLPPLNTPPNIDYRSGAITIQTNSDEIAPLPIQISKPSKIMNQHIVLTPNQRTADEKKRKRERESIKHVEDKFRLPSEKLSHRAKIDDQSDLPKNVRFAEKHEVRDRYSYRGGYLDREKPLYHEYHEKVHNIEHPVKSRFPELHYPGRLAHLEHSGRPRDLSTSEDSSPPRGYNRPSFKSGDKNSIRHHPGSYSHSGRERQPRYEATKFHEKLERIENWPRSTWKDFHSPSDSSNDEISARQQVPLVKTKKRTRYDDTHFTNFLKSQQKVTDMLEKILANNLKNNGPQSDEIP